MPGTRKYLRFFLDRPVLADLSAVLGMVAFIFSLWTFAHRQISVLDEGLYLFKGWLFATGQYTPFQDYGPWTNQMPLAFLIPGWVEMLFGPGLRTGRLLAVALGALMILGLWLTTRRMGGRWIAAGIVLLTAMNPAATRMYAMAASQGLIACLLAWTLWFSLGSDRKAWHLLAGGLLAGTIVMTRINMLPILPLLALYVLWSKGWKNTSWTLAGMLVVFGGVHLFYWPKILELWAKWLPFSFLRPWFPPKSIPTWNPDNPIEFRVASFFLAFRYHFAALAGSLTTWIFWPRRADWKSDNFKAAVFLSTLLVVLFFLHAWAALGNDYCVFCFPTYTSFYTGLGLVLLSLGLAGNEQKDSVLGWNLRPASWRVWIGGLAMLGLLAGMAYSAENAAEKLFGELFYKKLLNLPIPILRNAAAWQVIANKFQLEYKTIYDLAHTWFPVLAVLTLGLTIFIAAGWFYRAWTPGQRGLGLVIILVVGSLFSAAPVMAGDYTAYDCSKDVIPGYEAAGKLLAKSIPAGSRIYWAGYSPVTLLYLDNVAIFPPQLHGTYSYKISSDNNALLKHGWWNEALAEQWLGEADFILAEQKNLGKNDWLNKSGHLDHFELVTKSAPRNCSANSILLEPDDSGAMFLFRRK